MAFTHTDFVFIDFEACSLADNSWPIEVGVSSIVVNDTDTDIKTWDSLIRPDDRWDQSSWSAQSAAVHNIKREDLDTAPEAARVARSTMNRIRHKFVVADAPEHDGYWLNALLICAGINIKPVLNDFERAVFTVFDGQDRVIDMIFETLARTRTPHRAGADSARLAKAWARGITEMRKTSDPEP